MKFNRLIIYPWMILFFFFSSSEAVTGPAEPCSVCVVSPSAVHPSTENTLFIASATPTDSFQSFEDDFASEFGASTPTQKTPSVFDPFSGYNRAMTDFNDYVYINFMIPAARGYRDYTSDSFRMVTGNFFDNLTAPVRFANNLLQFKFENALEELGRFTVNSTIGLFGFFDPASSEGLERHPEDFGQTLGYYGFGSGFHFVLPLLGPSNLRDIIGMSGDSWISPVSYYHGREYNLFENQDQSIGARVFDNLNVRSNDPEAYIKIKTDALDLYTFLREAYEQNRVKQIKE